MCLFICLLFVFFLSTFKISVSLLPSSNHKVSMATDCCFALHCPCLALPRQGLTKDGALAGSLRLQDLGIPPGWIAQRLPPEATCAPQRL